MPDSPNPPLPRTRDDVLPTTYRDCFACGDDNVAGLQMQGIRREDDEIRASVTPKELHQGFPGIVHGGVLVGAMDEAMGYACRIVGDTWAMTMKMETRFRKPANTGEQLDIEAGLHPHAPSRRRFSTWARLRNPNGDVVAEAEGIFIALPADIAQRLEADLSRITDAGGSTGGAGAADADA